MNDDNSKDSGHVTPNNLQATIMYQNDIPNFDLRSLTLPSTAMEPTIVSMMATSTTPALAKSTMKLGSGRWENRRTGELDFFKDPWQPRLNQRKKDNHILIELVIQFQNKCIEYRV